MNALLVSVEMAGSMADSVLHSLANSLCRSAAVLEGAETALDTFLSIMHSPDDGNQVGERVLHAQVIELPVSRTDEHKNAKRKRTRAKGGRT